MSQRYKKIKRVGTASNTKRLRTAKEVIERLDRELKRGNSPILEAKWRAEKDI